jgi:hypothetical protein
MLGPANSADERNRVLSFLAILKRPELVAELRGELEQLLTSESTETAEAAKSLLQQVSGG